MKIKWINIAIVSYFLVFIIPVLGYLIVNFYWWLFDGNILNVDKMFASVSVLTVAVPIGAFLVFEIWETK